MANRLKNLFAWFNRQNPFFLIFTLIMANFIGWQPEGGEEQYFSFARQFMDPVWMPNSFTLNGPAGNNLVFQVVIGFLLKYFSFEQMTFFGRAINFLLYAIPLALIFRKLKISNIELAFLLQVIYFGHQSLYAGEWIFKNFEEKTLAYVFVFWSLYYLLCGKPLFSSLSAAIATYFHFLVGGWMFSFIIVFFIAGNRRIFPAFYSAFAYAVIVSPFVLYLYNTYVVNNPVVVNGLNTNEIYAFWRLKYHIGIFHDAGYFFTHAFKGVLLTLIAFGLCVFKFSKIKKQPIRYLNILNIIIFSQQLIFMVVAMFDRNALLAKTYPFRTNSISWLLFLSEFVLVARIYLSTAVYPAIIRRFMPAKPFPQRKLVFSNFLNSVLLLIFIFVFVFETRSTVKDFNTSYDTDPAMDSLITYTRENTPGSSVFIFPDGDRPYSFIRKAERERFVVKKFTPTKSATIYEWYKREQLKMRLRKDISLIDSISTVYQVNYLVSDSAYNYPSLMPEKEFGTHKLYRISKE